jgi:glycosyltransferase involved in cell wall biosynthesis
MAAGRPVVATNVGGAREAIVHGETGYLVPAGDHEQMADHIISLLVDHEGAKRMGESGRRRINEKFSSAKQLQTVEGLYNELLKQSERCHHAMQKTGYES